MSSSPKSLRLSRNLLSEAGVGLAVIALSNLGFLVYLDSRQAHANPYLGILAWFVAPAILIFGLALYVGGILIERRKRHHAAPDEIPRYPQVDLNDRRTRLIVISTAVGLILFVTGTVVGSYQVYHYTDSDAFCGTVCHQVMNPEYTAYKNSPHARVGCVGCHVGGGAAWYVRSKFTGTHQLFALLTHSYPKPIQTPVENMRPARETCEECHNPEKFFGVQLKVFDHYAYDEASTPRQVRLLMKVGGGNPETGPASGIHWHMSLGNEITYAATDRQRQTIPWVRIRDRQTGRITEYRAEGAKLTDAQLAGATKRRMDCIDCHSRPTHIYVSPDLSVDRALSAGRIDVSLPFIKQQAVAVLAKDYPTTVAALSGIAHDFPAWYQQNQPAAYGAKRKQIDGAVTTLQQIFSTTRFPEMHVDWRTHPNNVGHFTSSGCFRCHDDQHVSKDGKRISKECSTCHTVLADSNSTAAFVHPVDLGDLRGVNCADCHTGGGM
jgi:nitrate/TMAO reductase-like tetraheme cytochrome c subunit